MSAKARLKLNSAYVLRASDVEKIWQLLENAIGPVQAETLCADDVERTYTTAKDLMAYDNPPARMVRSIEFEARSTDRSSRATLAFTQQYAPFIEFSASGAEDTIVTLKQRVADIVDACRPWYSMVSRIDFGYVVIAVTGLAFLVFRFMVPEAPSKALSFGNAFLATLIGVLGLVGIGSVALVLNRVRAKLFPIGTFALGAGETRHLTFENIRWVVVVGFVVSLAASSIFSLMVRA